MNFKVHFTPPAVEVFDVRNPLEARQAAAGFLVAGLFVGAFFAAAAFGAASAGLAAVGDQYRRAIAAAVAG